MAGSADALVRLAPLVSAHRKHRAVREVEGAVFSDSDLDDAAGVLIVGDRRKSPRAALPGPFLRARNGRRVPAGWLPDIPGRIETFAAAAAEVQLRALQDYRPGPVVLLGESEPRALDLAHRIADRLVGQVPVFQWTAERIRRGDLMAALQGGAGTAIYLGRGVPAGWVAYSGFDALDAALSRGRPIGAILSLACSVACRTGAELSFCEETVLSGLCAAALGATGLTLHSSNVKLGMGVAETLRCAPATPAGVLASPRIPRKSLWHYRIIGDPLAPLIGDAHSLEKARQVLAPAPGEVLPVIPLSSWS